MNIVINIALTIAACIGWVGFIYAVMDTLLEGKKIPFQMMTKSEKNAAYFLFLLSCGALVGMIWKIWW
jgi:hypothetical protein